MTIPNADREILRSLAQGLAEAAGACDREEKAELWRRVNDLDSVRPMVLIMEVPWCEMNVDDELTLQTTDSWAQGIEQRMRRDLYAWRHFPADMIPDDAIACLPAVSSTGFGLQADAELLSTDPASAVTSHHYHRQIIEPEDVAKIKDAVVTYDEVETNKTVERTREVFDGVMPVRRQGWRRSWFAPWDFLVQVWGVEQALLDMVMRPRMVHDAMTRMLDSKLAELDQLEALNLLERNDCNMRIGSGGYGTTGDLPGADYAPERVRPKNMWGHATAQIFSEVSPAMHWEFALQHEMRWLERWGLTYYGCCEPLDLKMDVLRRIPNLRKISMSPWVKPERAAAAVGGEYVYSCKPNPAILAEDTWRPEQARKELRDVLEQTRGCHVEIVMKDISTVRYDPRRLWEWGAIAMELAEEFAR